MLIGPVKNCHNRKDLKSKTVLLMKFSAHRGVYKPGWCLGKRLFCIRNQYTPQQRNEKDNKNNIFVSSEQIYCSERPFFCLKMSNQCIPRIGRVSNQCRPRINKYKVFNKHSGTKILYFNNFLSIKCNNFI